MFSEEKLMKGKNTMKSLWYLDRVAESVLPLDLEISRGKPS